MKQKIKINWLGRCVVCGSENSIVETEFGSEDFLFEKDKIICSGCAHQGLVIVENGVAYAIWHSVKSLILRTMRREGLNSFQPSGSFSQIINRINNGYTV
ncbi:hypothetical protein AB6F57_21395 [Providencia hangzhouensis]|uniref:hypothetical protein n=1 Tax=Providencia hangzhouensis TaxID=3031799 RepID=UPI0034DCE230